MALLALSALSPGQARGSVADSRPGRTWVTNGPVQAVVRSGDTIYIAGNFSRVGPRTGPGVELALDGSQNPGLPEVTGGGGAVLAVASDGSGGWYIGGVFTHVGGVARNNIAHIRGDHSVDPAFDPNANDGIYTLAVSGSTVYAGGLFTSIGGQTRNRIAGLNATDGTATAFNPNADASVAALVLSGSGSIVYAGGRFANIGGLPRTNLAALNAADGTAVLTFNPNPDGIVESLAISGSTLYVGGFFRVIGGQPRSNIAALNAGGPLDGAAVPTFNPNANGGGVIPGAGGVEALAVSPSGATVYAGGLFTNIGGQNRRYLAALNAADGVATAFDPNPGGNIIGLAVSGDGSTIYAAGGFNSFNGLPSIGGAVRNYLAAINAADGAATPFDPNPNAAAAAIGVSASALYVGGNFSSLGGLTRRGVAALNAGDGTPTGFDPNASWGAGNATVYALAVSGSTVYAGGFFTSIGGQPRNYIAALNAGDGSATSWNPGASSTVEALALSGSILYAGGDFSSIGGQPRSFIAALNLTDGSPTAFDPNANSSVAALAVSGSLVYVGGFFTTIGGQTRNKIAALNAVDGAATSWNPDATAQANVLALAVSGATIYAGGDFTSIGGRPRKNIAALNAGDGLATGFDPQASDGVFALAVSGSTVYAAGFFSSIGRQPRNLVAELNPFDGAATSFDPGADPGFGAFALHVAPDGTLYAGGSFRTFDLAFQQGLISFAPLPATVPGAPTIRVATPGNGRATIGFTPPASDGGAPILRYTVTCNPNAMSRTGALSPLTVPGLANGASYACSVTATNLIGTSAPSATVSVTPAATPPATFEKALDGGGEESGLSALQDADGNFVVLGDTSSFGAGAPDLYLQKTDSHGRSLWAKAYGGTDGEDGYHVASTRDGGYILAARSYSFGAGNEDAYLVKLDRDGNVEWSKVYGTPKIERAYSVRQTSDGGYILSGSSLNYQNTPVDFTVNNFDILLIKVTASGDLVWTNRYDGLFNEEGHDVEQTPDGGYIVTGIALRDINTQLDNLLLMKTDANGAVQWANAYGDVAQAPGWSVRQVNGGYLVAGWANSDGNCNLLKVDSLGAVAWDKTYGGPNNDLCYSAEATSDGGLLLAGSTGSFGAGSFDGYLVKTDGGGNPQWSRAYGGSGVEFGTVGFEALDGGYLLAGVTRSFSGAGDLYMVKTDADGNSGCHDVSAATVVADLAPRVTALTLNVTAGGIMMATAATQVATAPVTENTLCASATIPDAPTIVTAIPGDGQAGIVFNPPVTDGGSPITSYAVTCNPNGITATGLLSPLTVTGLTNGATYSCSMTATNLVGTGASSAPVSVTPVAKTAFDFFTVAPCRVLDTRRGDQGGALSSAVARTLTIAGNCGIPPTAQAVSFNLTAASASAAGEVVFYPDPGSPPVPATIHFTANQTRANNQVLGLAVNGAGTLEVQAIIPGGGSLQVIVDVNGWFE